MRRPFVVCRLSPVTTCRRAWPRGRPGCECEAAESSRSLTAVAVGPVDGDGVGATAVVVEHVRVPVRATSHGAQSRRRALSGSPGRTGRWSGRAWPNGEGARRKPTHHGFTSAAVAFDGGEFGSDKEAKPMRNGFPTAVGALRMAALFAPAAAEAHHVTGGSAECALAGSVPTIKARASFVGFAAYNKPIAGEMRVDGKTVATISGFTFSGSDGTWQSAAVTSTPG